MKMAKSLVALAIVPVGLLSLASCSSAPKKPRVQTSSAVAVEEGVPGGKVVQTQTLVATVDSVKKSTREITLLMADGAKSIVKCGPEVRNFDQIRKGDLVTVQSTQELNVFMATGAEPAGNTVAVGTARAPEGAMPGASIAAAAQYTATVTAIDLDRHTATLQFPNGTSKTIAVRPDVDLGKRKVGEQVVIRAMEAMAISVQKK
jgi:hypothetical protein